MWENSPEKKFTHAINEFIHSFTHLFNVLFKHARRFSPTCPPTCPTPAHFLARILARMSVRDARVYACKRVLYTISYRVYTFTKLHSRRIPNVGVGVRVGVGTMEFHVS